MSLILTLRTDKPQSEIGLYENGGRRAYKTWQAHRELSTTIHKVIKELLDETGKDWRDIRGVIFYEGPGSFTGLRIGAAVANALASANNIPVVSQGGTDWILKGLESLKNGQSKAALPRYGSEPKTTKPKK